MERICERETNLFLNKQIASPKEVVVLKKWEVLEEPFLRRHSVSFSEMTAAAKGDSGRNILMYTTATTAPPVATYSFDSGNITQLHFCLLLIYIV